MSNRPREPVSLGTLTGYFLRLGTLGFGGLIALQLPCSAIGRPLGDDPEYKQGDAGTARAGTARLPLVGRGHSQSCSLYAFSPATPCLVVVFSTMKRVYDGVTSPACDEPVVYRERRCTGNSERQDETSPEQTRI